MHHIPAVGSPCASAIQNSRQIEAELATIEPELVEAKKALSAITPQQISEIRSLKVPPEPVRDVLSALLRLLGQSDCSWNAMKKFLGERGSMARLLNFDAAALLPAVRQVGLLKRMTEFCLQSSRPVATSKTGAVQTTVCLHQSPPSVE